MSRKLSYFIRVLLPLAVILTACAQPPAAPPEEMIVKETVVVVETVVVTEKEEVEKVITPTPVPGRQTIIVALAQAPTSLDPADHRSRQSETVIRNMFDGLVTRDNSNGVHLELAEEMNWMDDTTLEVKLRQGVKFHDGTEMTADDVVYTFNRIIQENMIEYPEAHTSPRKGLIAPLESVDKTGDYSVVMNFSGPWPPAM
ncbi:MAG TPA: ABC transporter substrate-binding protein, partial [Anaerolineales bacterium]